MQNNILENIAITINQHSRRYEARIPNELREYCEIINGRIIKVKNRVLRIEYICEKRKNKVWYIFERDIEKVILKISRRDKNFSQRVEDGSLTVYDVECVIRRCTFKILNLKMLYSDSTSNLWILYYSYYSYYKEVEKFAFGYFLSLFSYCITCMNGPCF